jgi:hypothetical protein
MPILCGEKKKPRKMNSMKRIPIHVSMKFAISFCTALIVFQVGCKDNPIVPTEKSPRQYEWDATKISFPNSGQTTMYCVWGSGATDVYVGGYNSLGGNGAIYHYDGAQWQPIPLPSVDYNYFWDIIGFGAKDVWAAGARLYTNPRDQSNLDSAVILHYDGVKWTSMLSTHMGTRGLKSVWGSSSQNLYFGSRDGKVIRFDGARWNIDTLYLGLSMKAIGGDETRVFAMGNTWKGALDDSAMCFMRTSGGWKMLDVQLWTQHASAPRFGSALVYSPAPGSYYSASGSNIFRWQVDRWIKAFSLPCAIGALSGTGEASMLTVGWRDGPAVYHWDGAYWADIKFSSGLLPSYLELLDVWTNGSEAFVIGNDGGVSYVLRGK